MAYDEDPPPRPPGRLYDHLAVSRRVYVIPAGGFPEEFLKQPRSNGFRDGGGHCVPFLTRLFVQANESLSGSAKLRRGRARGADAMYGKALLPKPLCELAVLVTPAACVDEL